MTTPTIYFAGGEDECMMQVGGGTISTTAGDFRSGIARCALRIPNNTGGHWWQNETAFTATSFWVSARIHTGANPNVNVITVWRLVDVNGLDRLRMDSTKILKVDGSGSTTTLFTLSSSSIFNTSGIDKVDIFCNYAVSGQISFYLNNALLGTFSGDVTTNSVTSLSYCRFGPCNGEGTGTANWSEIIVSDTDTRSWGLQTLQPVANGNTHNFDTGSPAAANVNEVTLDDTTLDGSTTAGQIDQYTIPAIVSSGYGIVSFGVSSRMAKGATGPSKMDLGVRVGSTDYWSSDISLGASLLNYQNWWGTDPSTSAPWLALPVNIGLKSVT